MKVFYFFVIIIFNIFITINILLYPSIAISDDPGNFANKLFNHYEYDDKINNYLKSLFSFKNSKDSRLLKTKKNFSKNNTNDSKNSLKFKSKNKAIYSFGNGQSLQIDPSNINSKIIYNKTPNSYFEIRKNSLFYNIKLDF